MTAKFNIGDKVKIVKDKYNMGIIGKEGNIINVFDRPTLEQPEYHIQTKTGHFIALEEEVSSDG